MKPYTFVGISFTKKEIEAASFSAAEYSRISSIVLTESFKLKNIGFEISVFYSVLCNKIYLTFFNLDGIGKEQAHELRIELIRLSTLFPIHIIDLNIIEKAIKTALSKGYYKGKIK